MLTPLRTLLRYRPLIQSLVGRELKARYRGSLLGFFWSFVNPLLLLATYTVVFTVILPVRHSPAMEPYALFFFCGILPWSWLSSSLLESSGILIAGGNLLKKVLFPAEVLPVVTVLANLVHFRDIQNILSHLLHIWFFASPILYFYGDVGGALRQLLRLNPMSHVLVSYQEMLFTGRFLHYRGLAAAGLVAIVVFAVGGFLFDRLRDTLAEEV